MKKHLIAAAVAAAVAAPAAMAQNVSLSGIIDQSVQYNKTDGKNSDSTLVSDMFVNSRLVLRGTEDLGGGLRAFFRLEQSIALDEGTQNNGWNRGAEVGVSGAFGSVKVGKFDLTRAEGIDSAVGQFGNVSNTVSFDITSDLNDSINYTSPNLNGWRFQVAHSFGDDNLDTGKKPVSASSASLEGKLGPADVYVGYQKIDQITTTKAVPPAGAAAAADTTAVTGAENKVINFGVKLPVGPATVGLYYGKRDNGGSVKDEDQTIISASMPVGTGLKALAMVGRYGVDGSKDAERMAFGVMKDLSKRTSLYAAYQLDSTATNVDTKKFALGLTHNF
jgi:predicted porin